MRGRRAALAGVGALALGTAAALSGTPAAGQLQLGGSVPDLVALAVGTPTGFAHLPGGSVYELQIPVTVTSTDVETHLSVADGEDLAGPARGHLHAGRTVVAAPLAAAVATNRTQLLSAPVDPQLASWFRPVTRAPATIRLRTSLPHGLPAGRLHKVLLITISSQSP